ncbi:hypothetical protein VUN82_11260 [Micrococcaceae bacterium Sec5.1]
MASAHCPYRPRDVDSVQDRRRAADGYVNHPLALKALCQHENPYSSGRGSRRSHTPAFPEPFSSNGDDREFIAGFVDWYTHEHRHAAMCLHTATDVHYGLPSGKAAEGRKR